MNRYIQGLIPSNGNATYSNRTCTYTYIPIQKFLSPFPPSSRPIPLHAQNKYQHHLSLLHLARRGEGRDQERNGETIRFVP